MNEMNEAYFDRYDICEAYLLFENDWHIGGWLRERKSNQRRLMATHVQLKRMQFKPSPWLSYDMLTDNGKAIYDNLLDRYGLAEVTE